MEEFNLFSANNKFMKPKDQLWMFEYFNGDRAQSNKHHLAWKTVRKERYLLHPYQRRFCQQKTLRELVESFLEPSEKRNKVT